MRLMVLLDLRRRGGKKNGEVRAAFEAVAAGDVAVVLADDAVAGAETQTGSLPDGLGGEKGFEDALRVADPGAVVRKLDRNLRIARTDGDDKFPTADFLQGFHGVGKDLQKDVKKLAGVG